MSQIYLIRHPQTTIDLEVPAREWSLSPEGRLEAQRLARQPFWRQVNMMFSSDELKAITTARIIANHTGVPWQEAPCLRELDRSSFQSPDIAAYRSTVARMFGSPRQSSHGWEVRASAEERIVNCIRRLVKQVGGADLAVISHGLILTILLAYLVEMEDPYEFWRGIGFGSVAVLETDGWKLLSPFDDSFQS